MAKRKIFSTEHITKKLREAEALLGHNKIVKEACRVLENSEQTYYRWIKRTGAAIQARAMEAVFFVGDRSCSVVWYTGCDGMI